MALLKNRLGWIVLGLIVALSCWQIARRTNKAATAYPSEVPPSQIPESSEEVSVRDEHENSRTEVSATKFEISPTSSGKLEIINLAHATTWTGEIALSSPDHNTVMIPVSNGTGSVPLGSWTIQARDEWIFQPDSVLIAEGRSTLVYAIQKKMLKFVVYDEQLAPIEGVIARFQAAAIDGIESPASHERLSGPDGRFQFNELYVPIGKVYFEKTGYRPFEQTISGFLADEIPIVLLREDYQRLRFVAYDDANLPIENVMVSTLDSHKIGVSDAKGEFLLGANIKATQDTLSLTGGCFPSVLVLEQLDSMMRQGAIAVSRPSRGTVTLIGTKANRAFFEIVGNHSAQVAAIPFDSRYISSEDAQWTLALPREMPAAITVQTDDGECGTGLFKAGPDGWTTQIVLDRSDVLEIVPLLDNRPAHGALATVMYNSRSISGSAMEFDGASQALLQVDDVLRIPFCSRVASMWVDVPGAERATLAPYGIANRAGILPLDLKSTVSASFQVLSNGEPLPGIGIQLDSRRTGMDEYPDRAGGWPTSHPSWTIRRPPSSLRPTNVEGLVTFNVSPGPYQASLRDTPGYWPLETLYSLERPVWSGQLIGDSVVQLEAPSPRLVSIEVWNGQSNQPAKRFDLYAQGERLLSNEGCYWEGRLPDYVTHLSIVIDDVGQTIVYLDQTVVQHQAVNVLPSGSIPIVVEGWQELDLGRRLIRVSLMVNEGGKGDEFSSDTIIAIDSTGNGGIVPPEWPAGTIRFDALDPNGIEFEPSEFPWPTSAVHLTCHLREEQP